MATVSRAVAHLRAKIRGARRMPPPIPVIPATKPITAPARTETARDARFALSSLSPPIRADRAVRQAASSRKAPTIGWYIFAGRWVAPPAIEHGIPSKGRDRSSASSRIPHGQTERSRWQTPERSERVQQAGSHRARIRPADRGVGHGHDGQSDAERNAVRSVAHAKRTLNGLRLKASLKSIGRRLSADDTSVPKLGQRSPCDAC
jgi:hypothetical protein